MRFLTAAAGYSSGLAALGTSVVAAVAFLGATAALANLHRFLGPLGLMIQWAAMAVYGAAALAALVVFFYVVPGCIARDALSAIRPGRTRAWGATQ